MFCGLILVSNLHNTIHCSELKDTLERVGSDLKNRIVDSLQSTWNKLYTLYSGEEEQEQQHKLEQVYIRCVIKK